MSNFLEKKIDNDSLPGNRSHNKTITTRFPPEPNGYLHIGHAKSILINFGLAKKYDGQCNMRFDDTNPVTEETEYVESILEDVQWITSALELPWVVNEGMKPWRDNLFYTSDYFEMLHKYAIELIKAGKAYVDSQSPAEVKLNRGNKTRPGVDSPFRNRSVEENLRLFQEMTEGKHKEGTQLLRAKPEDYTYPVDFIDKQFAGKTVSAMNHPNMNLRDPPIYRIKFAHHHRSGDKWCVYPIYDYAHGQSDAIEHITHSICTLEFENHNILYRWFIDNIPSIPSRPEQTEFARLEVEGAVTSKRKLLKLVKENKVMGWDDPRMLTICGLRRRGVRPSGIKKFCDNIGVTFNLSVQPMGLFEEMIREDLDPVVPRRMVVVDPIKVTITTFNKEFDKNLETVAKGIKNNPNDEKEGVRDVTVSNTVYIDSDDYLENAPPDFFRLSKLGDEVKLKGSYVIRLDEVVKDPKSGKVVEMKCSHDPETAHSLPKDRKIKGVVHWVDANNCVDATVRYINNLFKKSFFEKSSTTETKIAETAGEGDVNDGEEAPEDDDEAAQKKKDDEMFSHLNPDSMIEYKNAKCERCILEEIFPTTTSSDSTSSSFTSTFQVQRYQFERKGFFTSDRDSTKEKLVFNRTVALKEAAVLKAMHGIASDSRKEAQEKAKQEKERLMKIPPGEYFKLGEFKDALSGESVLFSKFDEKGVPSHDKDGEELTKSMKKKLEKEYEKQKRLYEGGKK